jgi:hypothetical protein
VISSVLIFTMVIPGGGVFGYRYWVVRRVR